VRNSAIDKFRRTFWGCCHGDITTRAYKQHYTTSD